MVIQRYGSYFLKLSVGDQVVGINPPSKQSKLKQSRFGSDVALQSMRHPDFDGIDALEHKSKNVYAVKGPGEYEISDIFIHGFPNVAKYDGVEEQINTVYSILFEGINIVYLGPVSNTDALPENALEELYQAEVIFIPIGGGTVLDAQEAFNFVKKFSPKIVIPLDYDKKALEVFASNFGEHVREDEKLTIKKKDVEGESMELVALQDISK